ncbi:hypothetical protein V3C99_006748 [Haemonchus contortus]
MMLVSSNIISTAFHNIVQNDLIPQPTCVYLQLASLFATCTSPLFLLGMAIDRLLAMMKFYKALTTSHPRSYIVAQILPGCTLGVALDVMVLTNQKNEELVECYLTTPMQGPIANVYFKSIMLVCVLIILCNFSFIIFLKKLRMSSEKSKSIYRSVIIISLSVVFGYFLTVVILSLKGALLNNETSFMDLLAGSIVNVSISVNFFVYYSISKEYRAIFDKVLGISHIKAMLKRSMPAVVRRVTHLSNPSPVRITVAEVN